VAAISKIKAYAMTSAVDFSNRQEGFRAEFVGIRPWSRGGQRLLFALL